MLTGDPDRQAPFLSFGFRPFFLLAGIYAVLAMTAWTGWLAVHAAGGAVVKISISAAPHLWHGHEMIFGYAAAALAGFMLTAIPGWTGARRVAGGQLVLLGLLWIAGRAAMWLSAFVPAWLVALLDGAFLPVLMAFVAVSMMRRPAMRNLIFLGLISLLIIANAMVHAEWLGVFEGGVARGLGGGLATLALLVVIVGGRVVPSFTRNHLMAKGEEAPLPRSHPALERAAMACAALYCLAAFLGAGDITAGSIALAAALVNAARLALWRGGAVLGQPIVWSLHLAYLWIAIGYGGIAAALLGGVIGETAAHHMLAIGAIGGMTLAVMTRAALGHTNRPLTVHPAIAAAYIAIAAAAIVRVAGAELFPGFYLEAMIVSGALWITGFALFIAVYLPILTGPPAGKGAR